MGVYVVKWGEYFGERNEEEFEYDDNDEFDEANAYYGAEDSLRECIDARWDWAYILKNGKIIREYDVVDESLKMM